MIKVFFPPGCYGTYVTRCIYNYSNLRNTPLADFSFRDNGSSHAHRTNLHAKSVIQCGHVGTLSLTDTDTLVSIIPCASHALDYYNNQFFKQERGQITSHILKHISVQDAKNKLKECWQYTGDLDESVPTWIMREWCSFWLADVLTDWSDSRLYANLNAVSTITTQDVFENWISSITKIISSLNLILTVDHATIEKQHQEFLKLQKFHNSQNSCQQYVDDLIAGNNSKMELCGIFDEAYIQHLLRKQNLEIKCHNLDIFPSTVEELRTLTYETSNNSNQGRS